MERSNVYRKVNSIAMCIIAVVAIVSLYYSIRTSNKVTKSLAAMTEPLVKFKDYSWLSMKEMNCDTPPFGIEFEVYNASSTAIEISQGELKLFYGASQLSEPNLNVPKAEHGAVLLPGEAMSFSLNGADALEQYFSKPADYFSGNPRLNFEIQIEYSRLGDNQRYLYFTRREIRYNCEKPSIKTTYTITEKVVKI